MSEEHNEQLQLIKRLHYWKMAFFGLIILIAGILIGSQLPPLVTQSQRPGIKIFDEPIFIHIQRELGLRPDQEEPFKAIYSKHLQALREIQDQARPKIAQQMNEFYADVSAVLDEEQQDRWNESIERLRERFMSRPGRPRDGRGPRRGRKRGRGGRFPEHRPFRFWEEPPGHEGEPPEHFPNEPPPEHEGEERRD